jgi:LmbE family N-acetylglucosaminyl deacetylase
MGMTNWQKGLGISEERDLVPYEAEGVLPAARVLLLAPHPDDEVFGCGGCARLHVIVGAQVDVVVLTDGGGAGDVIVRAAESRAGCAALGLPTPAFWGYADRNLASPAVLAELTQRVTQTLMGGEHDLVYAPSPWEVHPDHRGTARAVAEAVQTARRSGVAVQWAAYEVGAPLWPHRLVNIDSIWADKQAAMALYPSQLAFQPYDQHIEALNRYRSYTISGECRHAEALWLPDDAHVKQVISDWDEARRHPSSPRNPGAS